MDLYKGSEGGGASMCTSLKASIVMVRSIIYQ